MTNSLRAGVLLGPLLLLLGLCYALPFFGVVEWSVTLPQPGLGQYRTALTDPLIVSVFLRTLRICLTVTALTVAAAYAITLVWVRGNAWQRMLAELCILIPFWISVLARAFGWLALLSNRGILNDWFQALGLTDGPIQMTNDEFAVIVGMTQFMIPFAVFPLAAAMRALDERVLLAARGMGASRLRLFLSVFLPMTAPGVLGATLLTFVFAVGFFVTPAILGGGRSVMIAELIYLNIFQIPNWGLAAAASVILMAAVGVLMALLIRILRPGGLA